MNFTRPALIAAFGLATVFVSTAPADANPKRELRKQLRAETTLLRQSLYSSPDLHMARAELLRTTREWSEIRKRLVGELAFDEDYGTLRQQLLTAELELRQIAEWAPGGHPSRMEAALRVLNVKQKIRKIEGVTFASDPDLEAARQAMIAARSQLKTILDDIRYRLRNDQRLRNLRKQLQR
ncbi:MAG: hypothetical protein AAF656_11540 [Planctomycetota bacterium]